MQGKKIGLKWHTTPPMAGMTTGISDNEKERLNVDDGSLAYYLIRLVDKYRDLFSFRLITDDKFKDFIIKTQIPRELWVDFFIKQYNEEEIRKVAEAFNMCDISAFTELFKPIEEWLENKFDENDINQIFIARLQHDLNEYNATCEKTGHMSYVDYLQVKIYEYDWDNTGVERKL